MKFRFLKRFIKHYSWAHLIALGVLAAFIVLRATDSQPVQLLRFKVFDGYQQITPRADSNQPVVIIDLDDESLAEHGQWPWPRTLLAKLVLKLKKAGVVAVAYDIVFSEPDRTSPGLLADSIRGLDKKTKEKLRKMPSNDDTFARIMKGYKVVLGQSTHQRVLSDEVQRKSVKTTWANLNKATTVKGLKPNNFLYSFPSIVRNIETLENAAQGIGVFTFVPSVDGIVRRVPLVVRVGDNLYPTLALELYRVATAQPTMALVYDTAGMRGVNLKGLKVPTDRTGQIWMKFGKHDRRLYVSAKDVLNGTVDPQRLTRTSEQALWTTVEALEQRKGETDYAERLLDLANLRDPVDDFFEAVMVNDDDAAIRQNRLALLTRVDALCREVADISQLPG